MDDGMANESRLREALRSRNPSLYTLTVHLVEQAKGNLWHSLSTFPSGTSHTPEHTEAVENIASMLIPTSLLAAMTDDEISLLVLSCHYHDLGMVGTEADNMTPERRDRVRREHAVSIGVKLVGNWQKLGFPDETTAQVLAEICRGHRPKKDSAGAADWADMSPYRVLGPERIARVRLLSAMIYAADELHLGSDRASKREEDWMEIRDIEARRHWRRHQAISGPAFVNGALSYDVTINALSLEADLRKTIRKALFAVRDMRRVASGSGIATDLPSINLQWIRKNLWDLLAVEIGSDLSARTPDAIAQAIFDRFDRAAKDFVDITSLCSEFPAPSDLLQGELRVCVESLIVQEHLIANPETTSYVLSVDRRSRDRFMEIARTADEIETLFGPMNPPQHEHRLHLSPLGKSFIRELGFAEVKNQYAVDLAAEPMDSALRKVFESSPTAFRITSTINTPPGVLVKRDLLAVAVAAGVCFDLMDNPALVLDADFRAAVRSLFAMTIERLPRYQRFVEELALVGGLSYEQIAAMVAVSDEMRGEVIPPDDLSGPTVKISKTVPTERRDWALGWIMVAMQRTHETVTLLNVENSQLSVKVVPSNDAVAGLSEQPPVMIQFGPGDPQAATRFSFRAKIEFNAPDSLLRFTVRPVELDTTGFPFLLRVALSNRPDVPATTSLSVYVPELTVGTLRTFMAALDTMKRQPVDLQIMLDGAGLLGHQRFATGQALEFPPLIDDKLLAVLADFDPTLPFPRLAPGDFLDAIVSAPIEERQSRFASIVQSRKETKPHLTSIRLRIAEASRRDVHEEYLECLPKGAQFVPPTVTGDGEWTQVRMDKVWNAGDQHFRFDMHFREDYAQLASELRTWMKDPTGSFPFQTTDFQTRDFHFCKTTVEREHLPFIDRTWYVERPVIFRFRPASKSEQYRIEKSYWDEIGDPGRSKLVQERIEEAECEEREARQKAARHNSGDSGTGNPPDKPVEP
jgi:hypothetical protein